jgi:hypothetical protein
MDGVVSEKSELAEIAPPQALLHPIPIPLGTRRKNGQISDLTSGAVSGTCR